VYGDLEVYLRIAGVLRWVTSGWESS